MFIMSFVEPKGINSFSVYKEILPVVTSLVKFITDLELNSENKNYLFILKEIKLNSINILLNLAQGYNKYFSTPKCVCYNDARDNLSVVQSYLIILNELNIIEKDKALFFYNALEDKIKMFIGLIKKIEAKKVN